MARPFFRLNSEIERRLPEQRLFLKSDNGTRFLRLRPMTQALLLGGGILLVGWTILASAILFIDGIASGNSRELALRDQAMYESRLEALSSERDKRAAEAIAAQQRFTTALAQVSSMQTRLLASEERRRELETGIGVIQATLRTAMNDRDAARDAADAMKVAAAGGKTAGPSAGLSGADLTATLDVMTAALGQTAAERDALARQAEAAKAEADDIAYEMRLLKDRNDEIFSQLEDAVTVSMAPLDKMFTEAGMNPDDLIATVRRGYSGQGGPLMPLLPDALSTKGTPGTDADLERAGRIMEGLDRMNMYRIAAEKAPFALPLNTAYRFTSPYGSRWGRMHEGVDLAGSYGSPVLVTADGVVAKAGWSDGYGYMVEVRHEFGVITRYAHMSAVKVKAGQRVSRGDAVGAMGNSGRSTGTHLHYEVRVNGNSINPMTFIKAASNVF